ncbi:MAG: Uncharacterised protein [Rhodospirillaceae bacterium]|nr:MAG: Uncharacterised protein [Rhodospirillaceae bacterium]
MNPHGVEVFDRAHDDAVVRVIPDDLHLEFLPAQDRLLDQHLGHRRQPQARGQHLDELFAVVADPAALAPKGKGRAQDRRKAGLSQRFFGLIHGGDQHGTRAFQPNLVHGITELLAIFSLFDGLGPGADKLDTEAFQRTVVVQRQTGVEPGLPAHGRQQRVGALLLDNLGDHLRGYGLDVSGVGKVRVGHDRGRVRVNQNHPVAFLAQRLAGLGARIVKLAGLPDHNGAGADDHNGVDIGTFRHPSAP